MNKFYFLLMCPNCGNKMKYHTTTIILSGKNKRCVYCGKSFSIKDRVVKQLLGP